MLLPAGAGAELLKLAARTGTESRTHADRRKIHSSRPVAQSDARYNHGLEYLIHDILIHDITIVYSLHYDKTEIQFVTKEIDEIFQSVGSAIWHINFISKPINYMYLYHLLFH